MLCQIFLQTILFSPGELPFLLRKEIPPFVSFFNGGATLVLGSGNATKKLVMILSSLHIPQTSCVCGLFSSSLNKGRPFLTYSSAIPSEFFSAFHVRWPGCEFSVLVIFECSSDFFIWLEPSTKLRHVSSLISLVFHRASYRPPFSISSTAIKLARGRICQRHSCQVLLPVLQVCCTIIYFSCFI